MGTDTIGAAEGFSGVEVKLSSSAYLEETISGEAACKAARTKLSHESPGHVPPRQSLEATAFLLQAVGEPALTGGEGS